MQTYKFYSISVNILIKTFIINILIHLNAVPPADFPTPLLLISQKQQRSLRCPSVQQSYGIPATKHSYLMVQHSYTFPALLLNNEISGRNFQSGLK